MDAARFDHLSRTVSHLLTRRTLGAVLAGSALGLPRLTEAKKKRKEKKCKKCGPCRSCKKGKCKPKSDGTPCPDGACQSGVCQPVEACPGEQLCKGECIPTSQCCTRDDCPAIANYRCCNGLCTDEKLEAGSICTAANQCCSDYCRASIVFGNSTTSTCDATCRGKPCTQQSGCCHGFSCESDRCGGCGQHGDHCESDAECCFSDCTASPAAAQKQCLSSPGGPCEKDIDCRSCFLYDYQDCRMKVDGVMVDVCRDGVCGCPYECCADFECEPNETCEVDDQGLRGECKPLVGP